MIIYNITNYYFSKNFLINSITNYIYYKNTNKFYISQKKIFFWKEWRIKKLSPFSFKNVFLPRRYSVLIYAYIIGYNIMHRLTLTFRISPNRWTSCARLIEHETSVSTRANTRLFILSRNIFYWKIIEKNGNYGS